MHALLAYLMRRGFMHLSVGTLLFLSLSSAAYAAPIPAPTSTLEVASATVASGEQSVLAQCRRRPGDIDGDCIPNRYDPDIDGDRIPNWRDRQPYQPNYQRNNQRQNNCRVVTNYYGQQYYTCN